MSQHIVTEGISGVWHYHLSDPAKFTRALCGAQTMKTAIEAEDFGKPFGERLPKRPTWCAKCQELAATNSVAGVETKQVLSRLPDETEQLLSGAAADRFFFDLMSIGRKRGRASALIKPAESKN